MPNGPIYQARTHNHLTWVMVDATDFATPESALSGAKIMVNGKLQSTSLLYFVSSGTGSMAGGDIKHVGASATGVYTVNLVKADLSDASAAWYDQYIFTITGTGAAQQVIVCEGVLAKNTISNISDYLSKMSDVLSNAYSAAAQATSQTILTKTQATAAASRATLLISAVSSVSNLLSDVDSALTSHLTILNQTNSRVKGNSDFLSKMSDAWSDTLVAATQAASQAVQTNSRVKGNSDFLSKMSDAWSDTLVFATAGSSKATKIYSMLSDTLSTMTSQYSDVRSAVGAITVSITASDISDIASAVTAGLTGLTASDLKNVAVKVWSDFQSKVGRSISDVMSDLLNEVSDLSSNVRKIPKTDSDLVFNATAVGNIKAGLATQSNLDSTALNIYELLSDVDSAVSSQYTKVYSAVNKAGSQLLVNQSTASNIYELLSDVDSALTSQLAKQGSQFNKTYSGISDIQAAETSHFAKTNSQLNVNVITVNDTYSLLSAVNSDIQARVPKEVAARSQVSDLASDIKSAVGAITVTLGASDISDIASAVAAGVGSTINDIYSLLSGVNSDVGTVKTQTNKLTFTVSGVVDANIQRINDVTITGDGSVGDKFDVV